MSKSLPISSYTHAQELLRYIAFRRKRKPLSLSSQFFHRDANADMTFGGIGFIIVTDSLIDLLEIFLDVTQGGMFAKDLKYFLSKNDEALAPLIKMYFEQLRSSYFHPDSASKNFTQPGLEHYAAGVLPTFAIERNFEGIDIDAYRSDVGVSESLVDDKSQFYFEGKSPKTLRGSIRRAGRVDSADFPISISDMCKPNQYVPWPTTELEAVAARLVSLILTIQEEQGHEAILEPHGEGFDPLRMAYYSPPYHDFSLSLGENDINPIRNPQLVNSPGLIVENLREQLDDVSLADYHFNETGLNYSTDDGLGDFGGYAQEEWVDENGDNIIREFINGVARDISRLYGIDLELDRFAIPTAIGRRNFQVNSRPDAPNRLSSPTLAVFIMSDVLFNPSSRHVSQAALFSSGVPTTEMSLCSPFLRLNFITNKPALQRNGRGVSTHSNMISFLTDGSVNPVSADFSLVNALEPDASSMLVSPTLTLASAGGLPAVVAAGSFGEFLNDGVTSAEIALKTRTGMEVFTSPQTLVNMDINKERSEKVLDPTQPLMSLNSVSVKEYQSGYGLIGFKRATINITLHDRTRLREVAQFISPAGFSQVEALLEYGWSHPNSDTLNGSPWGSFLNSLRSVGKYRLIRGNYNMDQTGQVKITLEMGSMGGEDSKVTHVCTGDFVHISLINSMIRDLKATLLRLESLGNISEEIRNVETVSVADAGNQQMVPRFYYDDLRQASEDFASGAADEQKIRQAMLSIMSALSATSPETLGRPANSSTVQHILGNILRNINPATTRTDDPFLTNIVPFADQTDMSFLRFADLTYDAAALIREDLDMGVESFVTDNAMAAALAGTLIDTSARDVEEEEEEPESDAPETPAPPIEPDGLGSGDWVSLGKIVTCMVGHPLASTGRFDEVQVLFYAFNECAGALQSKAISDFPIRFSALFQRIVDAVSTNSNLTTSRLESILSRFVNNGGAQAYGFKDIYRAQSDDQARLDAERARVREAMAAARREHEGDERALSNELRRLDSELEEINDTAYDFRTELVRQMDQLGQWRPRFKVPRLKFMYEAVPAQVYVDQDSPPIVNRNKTILRIHVMDSNASAHPGEQLVLDTLVAGEAPAVFANQTITPGQDQSSNRWLSDVLDAQLLSPRTEIVDGPAGISIQTMAAAVSRESIHEYLRNVVPTVQFGTAHSPFSSVSISGMSSGALFDALLSDTFSEDDDDPQEQGTSRTAIEEVTVVPVTAKVSGLGNPMFHYGQQFYLDLKTGTTADNIFTVRDVTHNISPGTFTTDISFYPAGQNATVDAIRGNLVSALALLNETSPSTRRGQERSAIELNPLTAESQEDTVSVLGQIVERFGDMEDTIDEARRNRTTARDRARAEARSAALSERRKERAQELSDARRARDQIELTDRNEETFAAMEAWDAAHLEILGSNMTASEISAAIEELGPRPR